MSIHIPSQTAELESIDERRECIQAADSFKIHSTIPKDIYEKALADRLEFWNSQARELEWMSPWNETLIWNRPYAQWFVNGTLNASVNCVDRQLKTRAQKTALIWEGEDGRKTQLSYQDLYTKVNQFATVLKQLGLQKGDRVTLYLPMIPALLIAVLACSRIGAIHSVVFAGFSAQSLKDRIEDSQSTLLITADGGYRRGKVVPLEEISTEATQDISCLHHVLFIPHIYPHQGPKNPNWKNYADLEPSTDAYCPPEPMNSEDPLFILYTSGTTGKPKGIVHTTGGYLTHAAYSCKTVFDLQQTDIFWCTADIGWITGHSYVVYGPLANGATILLYEGSPDFPNQSRFWELIQTHKVSIFYTAPTAIRTFMKWGDEYITPYNLSSLRLLGTVGEPINPSAWKWYHRVIGGGNCPVVDTWWQTETGGIMISNLPAINQMKPGAAGLPLPGISAEILSMDGQIQSSGAGLLSLTEPWPSMLRGIWGDEQRFKDTYWSRFDTYYAGDGATRDTDGYFTVLGRVDDVLNVAGHRIGTMEVESSIVACEGVAEAAVVGMPDEIKGQAILAFVIPKASHKDSDLEAKIIAHVRNHIGAFAAPKRVILNPELPKTRSGKIIRRVLKCIAESTPIGDSSTLANPEVIEQIQERFKNQ